MLDDLYLKLQGPESTSPAVERFAAREPVHVVYGGAHLFRADTPQKLGARALAALDQYAPDFLDFAHAMWLKGADVLPNYTDAAAELEYQFNERPDQLKRENFAAWFVLTVYRRTLDKLRREPVEDFRIDFEDGYGFRPDEEEDRHAVEASTELAKTSGLPFCGFRIKSFQKETFRRAARTLDLFLTNLIEKCEGRLPEGFVVTLPKIKRREEVEALSHLLDEFERRNRLESGVLKIEIMIETPEALVNEKGEINLRNLVEAGRGRVISAHFGAFDYTASFGIAGQHQHLRHEACNFARQLMQIALAPMGIRLSDSVTTELPVPVHRGENLNQNLRIQNKRAVQAAWRKHFNNITRSLIDGFYQSWDLHPAQLVARYAAVYSFFIDAKDEQASRLKGFVEKATQAALTGNLFDDAASAQGLLNFFLRAQRCGAIDEREIEEITGLSGDELRSASFLQIMEKKAAVTGQ